MELVTKVVEFNVEVDGTTYDVREERVWNKEYSDGVQRWDTFVNDKRIKSGFTKRRLYPSEVIGLIKRKF